MRQFLMFVAMCAVCTAAPAPADIKEAELARPSPINPAVLIDPKPADRVVLLGEPEVKHRQKRDEAAPAKPHSIQAHELLEHNHHSDQTDKPTGHEAIQHESTKPKRESPPKPAGHEAEQHDAPAHHHDSPISDLTHAATQHDPKKSKRESPSKPAEHEAEQHDAHAHTHDAAPAAVLGHDRVQHESTKPKRESPSKPAGHEHDAHHDAAPAAVLGHDRVQHESGKPKRDSPPKPAGHGAEQHDAHAPTHGGPAKPLILPISAGPHDGHSRHQRDIPVPTEIKTTAAPIEHKDKPQVEDLNAQVPAAISSTPHSPLRHHPVPVSELFNKPKTSV
ncbi:submandibular gland secretory Glx-rich protein CA [Drosophila virilis]|uniref:submandibular gland secretory Glx-rich protein CA n=1 Tax=Drosophila virilis TaxID=7244 RepID=UPI001395E29D|nr:histidine-rich glycoprotein [Drosophila virilis]